LLSNVSGDVSGLEAFCVSGSTGASNVAVGGVDAADVNACKICDKVVNAGAGTTEASVTGRFVGADTDTNVAGEAETGVEWRFACGGGAVSVSIVRGATTFDVEDDNDVAAAANNESDETEIAFESADPDELDAKQEDAADDIGPCADLAASRTSRRSARSSAATTPRICFCRRW
jgi:hypothetical protein